MQKAVLVSKFPLVEEADYLLEGEMNLDKLFLHFTFKADKFTKEMYVEFLGKWSEIQEYMRSNDISEVFSLIPLNETKIRKWQTMFGLEPYMLIGNHMIYRGVL